DAASSSCWDSTHTTSRGDLEVARFRIDRVQAPVRMRLSRGHRERHHVQRASLHASVEQTGKGALIADAGCGGKNGARGSVFFMAKTGMSSLALVLRTMQVAVAVVVLPADFIAPCMQ